MQFFHHFFSNLIFIGLCAMLRISGSGRINRDAKSFDMLSASYLRDKLDNAFLDDSFILTENNLPIVLAFGN